MAPVAMAANTPTVTAAATSRTITAAHIPAILPGDRPEPGTDKSRQALLQLIDFKILNCF